MDNITKNRLRICLNSFSLLKTRDNYSLTISSGSMEAVKWIALLSMTVDHINRFFFAMTLHSAYCFGRLAMPLFAFIFAYNLARPEAYSKGLYQKVLVRLLIFGALATPGYIVMRQLPSLFPLNIMFLLAAATSILYRVESGGVVHRMGAFFLFLIAGFFVEYNWVGIFFCIAAWYFCKKPSLSSVLLGLIAFLLLDHINTNNCALFTIPLIVLASKIDLKIPRIPYFFYIYYPLHLSVFSLLSR